jgi:hypothetical protein
MEKVKNFKRVGTFAVNELKKDAVTQVNKV